MQESEINLSNILNIDNLKLGKISVFYMNYEEFVVDSIAFFENAKKRNSERLANEEKSSVVLHLKKEVESFSKMQGFWEQEKRRIEMDKKYSN